MYIIGFCQCTALIHVGTYVLQNNITLFYTGGNFAEEQIVSLSRYKTL